MSSYDCKRESSSIHNYFKRAYSEWNLLDFLNKSNEEPFRLKIDLYLRSLENIIKLEEKGGRKDKAQILLYKYRQDTDYNFARKWEKYRMDLEPKMTGGHSINITASTFSGNALGIGPVTGTFGASLTKRKDLSDPAGPSGNTKLRYERDADEDELERFAMRSNENRLREAQVQQPLEIVIEEETEKHDRDELPYCLNCNAEINISELMRFCPYCGSKIVSPDDVNELESDEDESVEYEADDDKNPPKINKLAFHEAYHAIPDNAKMHLKSRRIVEDVLFDFAKDMEHEHHAHSFIIDYDDENVKALFTEAEWNELTEDRIRIPAVPREIAEELVRYGKKTLSELRNSVMTSYLQDGTIYDINKHYNQEWIQMTVRTLVNLYENIDSPLIRNQYEDWYTVAFFGTCIDLCMRDIQLGTDIKRTDALSLASANRKNRGRSGNTSTRKLTGRKIDGIVYIIDRMLEMGAIKAARSFLGVSDQKYLLETFKMPKTLRDMYADLVRTANYDEQKANNLQVFGILHLGLWIQFARLYRAGGSICIFRKDPVSHHVDSKFSEDGIKSFLKFIAAVYQHKLIIRDNLHTLNIRNANVESEEEDLLNELLEVGNYSSTSQSSIEPFGPPQERKRDQKVRIRRKRVQ